MLWASKEGKSFIFYTLYSSELFELILFLICITFIIFKIKTKVRKYRNQFAGKNDTPIMGTELYSFRKPNWNYPTVIFTNKNGKDPEEQNE